MIRMRLGLLLLLSFLRASSSFSQTLPTTSEHAAVEPLLETARERLAKKGKR